MSGLELNKFAAAILVAGLIAMVAGKVTNAIYHPSSQAEHAHHAEGEGEKRGFSIAVTEAPEGEAGAATAEPAAPVDIMPLLASADAAAGKAFINRCTACHDLEKGGPNKVGPNLWSVVGRKVGSHAGYAYSDAMAGHGGNWDPQSLSEFLAAPKKAVPGTKMSFAGIAKDSDRANVIAYLSTLK